MRLGVFQPFVGVLVQHLLHLRNHFADVAHHGAAPALSSSRRLVAMTNTAVAMATLPSVLRRNLPALKALPVSDCR